MQNNPQDQSFWQHTLVPILTLFTSLGTILCCALPALLVTLGMGASLAGIISAAPWITVISEHKELIFSISGLLIIMAIFIQWRARNAPCPADPIKAKACMRLRKLNWIILSIALVTYAVGFFFAFIAVHVFY